MINGKEFWSGYEPLMPKDQPQAIFSQQLSYFEDRFGIDLTGSREVPKEHLARIKDLGHVFLEWAKGKGYVGDAVLAQTIPVVDTYMVLEMRDHRNLAAAIEGYRYLALDEIYRKCVAAFPGAIFLEDKRQIIDEMAQKAGSWEQGADVPPGNLFFVLTPEKEEVILGTFSDWAKGDPYQQWTIEGTVAEETLHAVSIFGRQEGVTVPLTSQQEHVLNETAIKYYVSQALKECGFSSQADSFQTVKGVSGVVTVWKTFVERCGQQVSDNLFFHNMISLKNFLLLSRIANDALRLGIVK